MTRRLTALAAALCLLLCACGGNPQSSAAEPDSPAPAEDTPVSEVQEPAEVPPVSAEEPAANAEEAPEDPAELGQWLWALSEQRDAEIYAEDYDMDMSMIVDLDGESTTEKVSGRVRQIEREDGTVLYQSEEQYQNTVTTTWYGDGVVYLSDTYGNFKAPMDVDSFREEYLSNGNSDLLELSPGDFEVLTGEKTDTGYTVTYGGVALDAWMAFSDLFGEITALLGEDNFSCESFTLDGTVTLDETGATRRHEMHLQASFSVAGMTLTEQIDMTMVSNAVNEDVTVTLPADDSSFRDVSDIEIPTVFVDGFNSTLAQDALSYRDTMTMDVSDPAQGLSDQYIQQDDLTYFFDSVGLNVAWTTTVTRNGEVLSQSKDSYSGGSGTISDDTGDSEYTYDDDSFGTDIASFITYYTDSFDSGNQFVLEPDSTGATLTYDLSGEYVEMLFASYLSSFDTGVDPSEASEQLYSGTMTVCFDQLGLMVSQRLDASAELTYQSGTISVTLQDQGDVTAQGLDVVISES